ncbi:MAG TPA: glutamate ABC transporter substrate-binding protein [Mycobacteriales bacterium]
MRKRILAAGAATLALALTACGESSTDLGSGGGSTSTDAYEVVANPSFTAGSTMEKLNKAGKIKIGVKYDQPGIGNKNPSTGKPEGFDIEIGKIVAGQLGLKPDQIEFVETVSKNREPFIENGTVDIVVASYSITDKRKKVISFAGPYYITGQDLLIRKEDAGTITGPEALTGKTVCSVTGSTPLAKLESEYKQAKTQAYATYTECVDKLETKGVDAVSTDGAILLGYAANNPDQLQVVGKPFSTEKYGIGLKKDDTDFRAFLNTSLEKAFSNGAWKKAYDATLGKSGSAAPAPPALEKY